MWEREFQDIMISRSWKKSSVNEMSKKELTLEGWKRPGNAGLSHLPHKLASLHNVTVYIGSWCLGESCTG